MAFAKPKYGDPIMEGVEVTLTCEEANHLMEFLGSTHIGTVEMVLTDESAGHQEDVNSTLYEVYSAIHKLIPNKWDDI